MRWAEFPNSYHNTVALCAAAPRPFAVGAAAIATQVGRDLSFPGFMLLIYTIACRTPGSELNGKYAPQPRRAPTATGVGRDSQFWQELVDAFAVLETDFRRFDKDNSGLITFAEITAGMPPTRPGCPPSPPPPCPCQLARRGLRRLEPDPARTSHRPAARLARCN